MVPIQQMQSNSPQTQTCAKIRKHRRRSGACNQNGSKFEIKMAALIYLRARRLLKSFQLALNDDSAGAFDDIVLEYNNGCTDQEVLIQLKHLGRMITTNSLAADKGDFSLKKLFSSVRHKLCKSTNTHFVFLTNTTVKTGSSKSASNVDNLMIDLICTSGKADHILGLDEKDEVCNLISEESEVKEFIGRFSIFSEQMDVKFLDELIKQEFIKLFSRIISDYKTLILAYLDKMEAYWSRTDNVYCISERWKGWDDVTQMLGRKEVLLSKIHFNKHTLSELAQKLLKHDYQKVHLKCNDMDMSVRGMQVNQALQEHGNQRYLFTSFNETEEDLKGVLKLWENDRFDILVVDQGNRTCSSAILIDDQIFNNTKKKLILISDGKSSTSRYFSDILQEDWYEVSTSFSFDQLDQSSQSVILDRTLSLQGSENKLRDLEIENVLFGETLTSLLTCENLCLGNPIQETRTAYISRTLCREIVIKKDILSLSNISDVFYVLGVTQQNLNIKIREANEGNNTDIAQFTAITDEEFEPTEELTGGPVHVLEMKEDKLYWRRSFGDPSNLQPFLDTLQEETEDIQKLLMHCKTSTPLENDLAAAGLRKVIVAGEPGIGKSDLLLYSSQRLKQLNPASWIISINLEKSVKYLKNEENGLVNKESVLRMLADAGNVQSSPVGKIFLEEALQNTGKVCILCDGFDEIFPKYSDLVFGTLDIVLQTKISALWVSSRQVVAEKLESCLQTKAYSLQPFTRTEIHTYLRECLGKEDAIKVSEMFQSTSSDVTKPIHSFPLHLMMICDLIKSGQFQIDSKMLNLYELYKSFIDIILEKYLNQVVKDNHPRFRRIYAEDFMKLHMICSLVALDIVNELQEEQRKDIYDNFTEYSEEIRNNHEKTGIIDGLSEGQPRFVHRTFAEYFAALWLVEHKENNFRFIGVITFDPQQNVLRDVFNRLLAENCPIHLSLLDNDVSAFRQKVEVASEVNCVDAGGRTLLHLICLSHAAQIMETFLCMKPDLELKDRLVSCTPLYYAVRSEFWDGVRLLLRHGARVENSISQDRYVVILKETLRKENSTLTLGFDLEFEVNWPIFKEYKTILHLAATSGNINCMNTLLEKGANNEIRDKNGDTPLHDAVSNGHWEATLLLLRSNASFTAVNKLGDTPLHMAVRLGKENQLAQHLLELGANTNVKNMDGDTPLHDGVRFGDRYLVKLLLDHEATIMVENKDGNTPLHLAIGRKRLDNLLVVELLLKCGAFTAAVNKDGDTPLHLAVKKCNVKMVELLLKGEAPTEITNKHGDTPLHVASRERNTDIAELLLAKGALPTAQNRYGITPLHAAVRYNKKNPSLVQLLLDNNASPAVPNNNGDTPLHEALKEYDSEVIDTLLNHKASITDVNKDADTPLHIAVRYSNVLTVKLLLRRGAQTGALNKDGDTPLHVAIRYGKCSVVIILLWKDESTVSVANNSGDTPLHVAAQKRNPSIIKELLRKGACREVQNKNGETPLSIAKKFMNEEIVNILQEYVKKPQVHSP